MQVREIISRTSKFFSDKGIPSARLDAELIVAHVLGWSRVQLYLKFDYPLESPEVDRCREMVRRRSLGEPVAYLLGKRDFYKATFQVRAGVLIPRPETELVVEEGLRLLPEKKEQQSLMLADFGCGSGCIGQSLLLERDDLVLTAIDVEQAAIDLAKENAVSLGLDERIKWEHKSVDAIEIPPAFSLIVANPPYIAKESIEVQKSVKDFEPSVALFSGHDGLDHIRSWVPMAYNLLLNGGWTVFEIGYDQANEAQKIFAGRGFVNIAVKRDLANLDRVIIAQKPE